MDRKWRSWTFTRILGLAVLLGSGNIHGYRQYGYEFRDQNSVQHQSKPVRISAFEALSHVSKRSEGSEQQKKGFYGFLGCIVNEDLCLKDEVCVNDNLFGSCQTRDGPLDHYQYRLTRVQKLELEAVLERLIRNGYTWRDLYTQCLVGDYLLAFQLQQIPDPDYCRDGSIPVKRLQEDNGWSGTKGALEWTGGSKYQRQEPNVEDALDDYSAGDAAFINIHKYQKQRRREPVYQSYLSFSPLVNDNANSEETENPASIPDSKNPDVENAILQYLLSLKTEDLDALEDWLTSEDERGQIDSAVPHPSVALNKTADVNKQQINNEDQYEDNYDLKYLMDIIDELSDDKGFDAEYQGLNPDGKNERYYEQTDIQLEQKRVILDLQPSDIPSKPTSASKLPPRRYDIVDTAHVYFTVDPKVPDIEAAESIILELARVLDVPVETFSRLRFSGNVVDFRVDKNLGNMNASTVSDLAMERAERIQNSTGFKIIRTDTDGEPQAFRVQEILSTRSRYFVLLLSLCGVITGLLLTAVLLYLLHRYLTVKEKVAQISDAEAKRNAQDPSKEYQDLCRQHMSSKLHEKPEPMHVFGRVSSVTEGQGQRSPSSRSSTSSWSEEPVSATMDILTGHMILSYMEDHLNNKDRLDKEWDSLKAYEPELIATSVADQSSNKSKNRYLDIVPYDHSRVILQKERNENSSDYINASTIMDHDPRNPAYIVTQGPLQSTVADFWQMIWENGCMVVANLTKQKEKDTPLCYQYWPSEGSIIYHIYEVHLVSEHIWCDDYLIRSFYLKNLHTNETRTVTQFHYMTWPDLGVPSSSKAILDFRRKVNKSFRGRSCPILVHCSDGAGRSGTYCLIDMVLNRISKGVKEIDIAATLEHIRDQRMQAVKTKEQFQFVLATVAEEVHAILKALPQ